MQDSAQVSAFNLTGRSVDASHGIDWIGTGFGYFKRAPVVWIICVLIAMLLFIALSFVPVIGNLTANVLFAVFAAGLMRGADKQSRGETFEVGDVFSGFQGPRFVPLIIVGAIYTFMVLALLIVAMIMFMIFVGASGGFGAMFRGGPGAMAGVLFGAGIGAILIGLVVMAIMVPIAMAIWFAPALVALNDVEPVAALKASFSACLKNFVPFLLYGIIMFVLIVVGSIPLGLGLIVVLPLIYTSTYAAYRDIFTAT